MKELEFQDLIWKNKDNWSNFFKDMEEVNYPISNEELLTTYTINKVNNKLKKIHNQVRLGKLISKERRYKTSDEKIIKIDFVGFLNGEEFVVEIKTNKNSERNSSTELNAYTKALNKNAPLLSPDETISVNITNFYSGISKESYLKEILYTDKKTIAYTYDCNNNNISLNPVLITKNDIPELRVKLNRHTVHCFKIDFLEIKGDIEKAPDGGLLDMYSNGKYKIFCQNISTELENQGQHGCIIGKTLWSENTQILKDNDGKVYRKNGNEIYAYIINPYLNPCNALKYSIEKKKKLIENILGKYYSTKFTISLVTNPSDSHTFWHDQHIYFRSFGMIEELYLSWSKTDLAKSQFDELNYNHHQSFIINNVNIFTTFLENIDFYFL